MNVEQLIEELKKYPPHYEVVFESGDAYGSAYLAYVDEVEVIEKNNMVELKEL